MSLFTFKGMEPPRGAIADINKLKQLDTEKLKLLIEETINFYLENKVITEDYVKELEKKLEIESDTILSGFRILQHLTIQRFNVSDIEFISDLQKLGLSEDHISTILSEISDRQADLDDKLRAGRMAIIPRIRRIHWHIDIRTASSEYLPQQEVYAVMRLFITGQDDDLRIELDKKQLVWFETVFERIKENFIEAEKSLSLLKDENEP